MADKIRVAHVIPRYFPVFGGAETQCRLLVRHLLATGEVEIPFLVTGRIELRNARIEQIDDVKVYRLGSAGVGRWQWYWFYIVSSWFLIRHRKDYDIIHCHATSVMGLAMTITGKLARKPVILKLSSNGELLVEVGEMGGKSSLRGLRSVLRKWLASFLATHATIVALNREGGREVEAAFAGRSIVIPNGVDDNQFRPLDPKTRQELRSSYGFCAEDSVLLFVGRFVAEKGINTLLEAFNQLASKSGFENVHLCLAGGGRLQENAVAGLVDTDVNRQRRIHVLPPKIPAVEYYQMADLFVSPSQREGLPNVVLEALAVGLPCVLSDIDPHIELMETNPKASIRLFSTDSVELLYGTLRSAFDLDSCRIPSRLDESSLASIYRIENVTCRYLGLYSSVKGARS
jgi:glycosyltransferase involved in cell wall biosynthesis